MTNARQYNLQEPNTNNRTNCDMLRTLIFCQVVDTLGEPMKAYGEMTRRGRRRYVRYVAAGGGGSSVHRVSQDSL